MQSVEIVARSRHSTHIPCDPLFLDCAKIKAAIALKLLERKVVTVAEVQLEIKHGRDILEVPCYKIKLEPAVDCGLVRLCQLHTLQVSLSELEARLLFQHASHELDRNIISIKHCLH